MITQHKISDIKYEIERISDDSPGSVTWINLLNVLSAILSIVLVPFTAGTSLLFLLGIPLYSASSKKFFINALEEKQNEPSILDRGNHLIQSEQNSMNFLLLHPHAQGLSLIHI